MKSLLLRTILPLVFFLCAPLLAQGQGKYRFYDVWYSRDSLGLDFRSGAPVPGNNTPFDAASILEGMGSICDRHTGNLLFYSNGEMVWNRNHQVMLNGTGLNGGISYRKFSDRGPAFMPSSPLGMAPLIVPHPGDSLRYYIFYMDPVDPVRNGFPDVPSSYNLVYAIVDLRGDNGLGEVVSKNILLLSYSASKLVAVRHGNGSGYWIVTHETGSDRFFSWLLTEKELSTSPVISRAGSFYQKDGDEGFLKASPDGTMLFAARGLGYIERVALKPGVPKEYGSFTGELLQFDHCSGVVGQQIMTLPASTCGSFSPNNRFLYTAYRDSLFQYDLQASGGAVLKSKKLLNAPGDESYFYGMQIAPNGKIYLLNAFTLVNMRIGVIENPNIPAPTGGNYFTVFYRENNRSAPGLIWGHRIAFPNCIDGYLGDSPVQDPTDVRLTLDGDTILCRGEGLPMHLSGALRYEWSPADGISCPDCADVIAWPTRTTTYRAIGYRYRPCPEVDGIRKPIDTVWVTIEVREPPVADAGRDTTLCAGESVRLKGTGNGTYQWSPAQGLSCIDCAEPIATPQTTTTYRLTVTAGNGCADADSVEVTVASTAVEITAADTSLCRGEVELLLATGGKEYRWSPAEGLNCVDCPAPAASPQQTTTYVVQATVNGICPSVDSITVVVHDPAIVDAGRDTTICVGQSVRLHATGGESYSWLSGVRLDCDTCASPLASPVVTTTFRVWIVDENGCAAWDSVTVHVKSEGELSLTGDTAFCVGGTAFLSASGAESYEWTPSAGLSCSDCANPVAVPTETTVYYVIGANASGGCASLDSVVVVVYPPPTVDAGNDTAICAGDGVRLQATGGVAYRWDESPDLSCLDCPNPVASPKEAGLYYVTAFSSDGCAARDSVRVEIHPSFVVNAGEDVGLCVGDTVQLHAVGGVAWRWEPTESLSCSDCPDPLAFPTTTTVYRVTAVSAEGCVAEDRVQVNVRVFPQVIRARIARDYTTFPGSPVAVRIEMADDASGSDIGELFLELEYDATVMTVDATSVERLLAGTLLAGWSVEILEEKGGRLVLRLRAPSGDALQGRGDLLAIEVRSYLANAPGTTLPFRLSTPSNCFVFESDTGYVKLDSICGLNLRLIELNTEKYVAPAALPNPAGDRVRFEFGLGLDGATRMEIFDARGRRVAVVVDAGLEAGRYSVEWDAEDQPAGVYYCRLSSGDWSRTERLIISD